MTDGTPGFDSDNNPGNDSEKSNKIVRSFDYVNYDLEYVTAITDKTKVINEAYVGIEFSLDKDPSKAVFNKDSIAWCENPVTTYYYEDGTNSTKWNQNKTVVKQVLTGRRKITNNADTNAIPGIGTLSFGVYVKGDVNGAIIQPEFKCWIEGTDKVKSTTSEAVTVSAEPRYNIRLIRNTSSGNPDPIVYISPDKNTFSLDDKAGYLKGRMENYALQLEILNVDTDKGLKGVELPTGPITFNLKATEKISLTVNKKWDDAENQDGIRPDSVKAVLYANGKKAQDIELNESNHWSVSVPNLYKNENGKPIQYEVKEIAETKGYTSSVSNKGNTWTITNTHKPSKISVSGTKTWKDDNDRAGVRPDSVTVRLFAEDKEIAHKKINAQSDWKYEFTDLDEFKAGQKIAYSITEDEVEGYKSEIQDYRNVSNTDESDGEGYEEDVPTLYAQFIPDKDAEYEFDFVVKNTHEVKPKAVEPQSPTPPAQVTVSSDEIKTGIHLDYSVWMILGCFCLGCLAGIGLHKIKQKRTRG